MKRFVPGLNEANASSPKGIENGLFLVRVEHVRYRWHAQRPYYRIRFAVLEPKGQAGSLITGSLNCTLKALWKLNWFLRDFGYDPESLGRDQIDDKNLVGLKGVIQIRHAIVNGTSMANIDGFASASQWQEFSAGIAGHADRPQVAS